jgi:ATPase subunit of ABC transporter with duplicated ATPase domains
LRRAAPCRFLSVRIVAGKLGQGQGGRPGLAVAGAARGGSLPCTPKRQRQKAAMLHVTDLTYRLGERALFDGASFAVPTGARVGVLGRNGAGKSTLFRVLLGEVAPESGTVGLPRGARIGAVAQEAPSGPERLIDVVLAADTERTALLAEAEHADGLRRAEIETRLADIGAHSAPARAAAILHGLGFDAEAQERPCSAFSGGWRMRVALAAILFSEPDLLLLDEPTNYLDIEGTLWLYDFLGRYPHTIVVISHDRDLLDTCVDHILHLDEAKLTLYRGGYSSFERQRAEKQALQAKARVKQEHERKHLQAFVDRFRAKASKARQAQSRIKRLEKLQPIAALMEDEVVPFDLPSPSGRSHRLSSPSRAGRRATATGWCSTGSTSPSCPTTASRFSAPTATASPPSASSSAGVSSPCAARCAPRRSSTRPISPSTSSTS